jgi:glycosyltransferase involved in cell wall biosynthesis
LQNPLNSKFSGERDIRSLIDSPPTALPTGVSVVLVNYRTPDLLDRAILSLRQSYPVVHLLIIDNASGDESAAVIRSWKIRDPERTDVILNDRNRHHGPAMDQALHSLSSPFVLFLDSDCEVRRSTFIEEMPRIMNEQPENYAVGKQIFMNRRGFDVAGPGRAFPYIRPVCMLIRRSAYLGLPPFRKHGTPCLRNMIAAAAKGYRLIDFPTDEFVSHEGRGTASRHGYRLGWRGMLNHLLNKAGI